MMDVLTFCICRIYQGFDNVIILNAYDYLPVQTQMAIFVWKADGSGYIVV